MKKIYLIFALFFGLSFSLSAQETVIAVWDFVGGSTAGVLGDGFTTTSTNNNALGWLKNGDQTSATDVNSVVQSGRGLTGNGFSGSFLPGIDITPTDLVDGKLHISITYNNIDLTGTGTVQQLFMKGSGNTNYGTNHRMAGLKLTPDAANSDIKVESIVLNNGLQYGGSKDQGGLGTSSVYSEQITLGTTMDFVNMTSTFWVGSPGQFPTNPYGLTTATNDVNQTTAWNDATQTMSPNAVLKFLQFCSKNGDGSVEIDQFKISTGTYENTVASGDGETTTPESGLALQGIIDFKGSTGTNGKAIHLLATADVPDLSVYAFAISSNGNNDLSSDFTLPAGSASAGDHILLARDAAYMNEYMSASVAFSSVIEAGSAVSQNGDDPIALLLNDVVVDQFQDPTTDGTGTDWEYTDSWAYKIEGVWTYGGVQCTSPATLSTWDSNCIYPFVADLSHTPRSVITFEDYPVTGDTWNGDSGQIASIVADPDITTGDHGNVGKMELTAEGNPWQNSQLSLAGGTYAVNLLDGTTKRVTFDMWSETATCGLLKFEQGLNGAGDKELPFNVSGSGWETISVDFQSGGHDGSAVNGEYNKIVLFFNYCDAAGNPTGTAPDVRYIDNISYLQGTYNEPTAVPDVCAPVPTQAEADVLSVFSDAYSVNIATNTNPGWGQATNASVIQIGPDSDCNTLQYEGLNYQGLEYTNSDVSAMDYVHLDYFTFDSTDIRFSLISPGAENAYDIGTELGITTGQWVSVDIPLTHFTAPDLTNVFQFKTEGNGDVFLDNLYFWSEPTPESGLALQGIIDFKGSTGTNGKAIHLLATADVPDLSVYAFAISSNGNNDLSSDFTLPAGSASAGDHILLARDAAYMNEYMSASVAFSSVIEAGSAVSQNGDDPIALLLNDVVVDQFQDPTTDGTGTDWEYTDSWAYKIEGVWTYGGVQCTSPATLSTWDSNCIYPFVADLSHTPRSVITFEDYPVTGDTWNGDSGQIASIVADPDITTGDHGNVGKMELTAEGNPWQNSQLSLAGGTYAVNLLDGTTKRVTFDMWSETATCGLLKFEQGLNGAGDKELPFNVSGSGWETISVDFQSGGHDGSAVNGEYNKIVLFFNYCDAAGNPTGTAPDVRYIDNISYLQGTYNEPTAVPDVCAPVPTQAEADVLSVFSDAYSVNIATNTNPGWGQATNASVIQIGPDSDCNTLQYEGLNYQGLEYTNSDVSAMDYVHLDYFTFDSTDIRFSLISPGAENAYDIGTELGITTGQWVSVDIPLTHFTVPDLTNVFQFKTEGNGDVFLDNLYFWSVAAEPGPSCDHTFVMNDSFGDGWNGASVDILVGGTVVATTIGPASGSASENLIFSATLGETIELSWTSAGSWSGEISWSVLDGNDGSEIGSGGNPSDGLLETVGLANCYVPPSCDHTFVMNDSFGDGWNGASVDILVGGTVVATTIGPASGSASENLTFAATEGETIELSWTSAGSWSGEISWSVLDGNDGSEIGSGGNPSDGLQETVGLANCTPAACPAPTDLTASGITTTGAVISWVSDGTQFMIELQPAGSAQGTEGGYVVGDIDPYTATSLDLTGFLTANTSYDIYVVNVCDGAQSEYAGPLTFTTLPLPIVPDYVNDFSTYPGDLWSEAQGSPTTGLTGVTTSFWGSDGFANNGFSGAARMNIYSTGRDEWLISPTFDLSAMDYFLNLDAAATEYSSSTLDAVWGVDDFAALYVTTDDGVTWTELYRWDGENNPGVQGAMMPEILLSGYTTAKFGIYAESTEFNEDIDFFVDNFSITAESQAPSCFAPTSLSVSNVTTTGAVVSWVSDGTQFMIEIQPAGSPQGTAGGYVIGDVEAYTATSVDLTGYLTAGTSYDIYVVNVCDADSLSEYSGPVTFTTPHVAACGETVVYDQVANGDYTVVLSGGNPASVTINGNVESGWDYLYVTDGAGNALNADQNTGIFTDATYTSTDGTISVNIVNDGSIQNGEVTMTFSCVPPDTTAPVITLTGDEVVELFFGDSYTDAGASASDDIDGDLTASIVVGGDTVDTLTVGTYVVTYNVSDAAGNPAIEVTRTVNVTIDSIRSIITFEDYPVTGDTWYGDSGQVASIVADPDTSGGDHGNVGKMELTATGQPWQNSQLNLTGGTYAVNLLDGTAKRVIFEMWSETATCGLLKFEQGLNGAENKELPFNVSGTGWETIVVDFTDGGHDGSAVNGEYNKIVLFFNYCDAAGNPTGTAPDVRYIDNISYLQGTFNEPPFNPGPAPIPTAAAEDVISIYSDTYTQGVTSFNVNPGWGQATSLNQVTVAEGDQVIFMENLNYQGHTFDAVDLSSMTHVHFDYYNNGVPFGSLPFSIINTSVPGGTVEQAVTTDASTVDTWVQVDIALSEYTNMVDLLGAIDQLKWGDANGGSIYIDNLYFYYDATAGLDDLGIAEFNYFPNPVNDILTINAQSNIKDITVYNMLGQIVIRQSPNVSNCAVDMSTIQTGAYFVQVTIGNSIETVRVLKK